MLVPAIDVGAGDPDPLRAYFVVGRIVRREDWVNAREEQAWRYVRLDHLVGCPARRQ
jgi:hypothetical protein